MEEKKIKIEIKSRFSEKVLFEYEKVDNTVKDTLVEAVKCGANMRFAFLHGADLSGVDLSGAFLCGADLFGADLRDTDLSTADMRFADLRCADLRGADLSDADLGGAGMSGTDLRSADLRDTKNVPFIPFACPSDGAFIGWKKVNGLLVKLEIPEDARRCSATGRKCRSDYAKVLKIIDLADETKVIDEVVNKEHAVAVYKVGENVYPDSFDENRWNECSHGIHFFINKQEAIDY